MRTHHTQLVIPQRNEHLIPEEDHGPWSNLSKNPEGDLRTWGCKVLQESSKGAQCCLYMLVTTSCLFLPMAMGLSRELLGGLEEASPQLWHEASPKWQLFFEVCQILLMHGENQEFPCKIIWPWLDAHPRSPCSLGLQIGPIHHNTILGCLCTEQTLCPSDAFIQGNNYFENRAVQRISAQITKITLKLWTPERLEKGGNGD